MKRLAIVAADPSPRPWTAIEWSCHAPTTVVVDEPQSFLGKHTIAECDTAENARLIAAAPDLLAAARKAEAIFSRQKWLETSPDPEAVALRELRAAIAKAGSIAAV